MKVYKVEVLTLVVERLRYPDLRKGMLGGDSCQNLEIGTSLTAARLADQG